MKRIALLLAVAAFCGCINLYTRFPTSEPRIEGVYQSTRQAAALSLVASFPQMMSDCPGKSGFMLENCLTIPFLGFPCAVDTALEFCVDTVCVPFDWMLSAAREEPDRSDGCRRSDACQYADGADISPYALIYRQEIIDEATEFYLRLSGGKQHVHEGN